MPKCARVAAQVTTVVPPRSESLIPNGVIDPCGDAALGIREGNVRFTQRSQLLVAKTSLTEFADVFTHSADDLGRASIVKHEIRTNESKPIRQSPRLLPISQQAVAEKENMLKRGVIEPPSSLWASSIVLVRKKDGTTRFCVD